MTKSPTSERAMRATVCKGLRTLDLHVVAVDNETCCPGTPDVYYCGLFPSLAIADSGAQGWIELKFLARAPKRADRPVTVVKYTPQQRIWQRVHMEHYGVVHVLILIGDEWLMIPGNLAADHLGKVPIDRLRELACAHWTGGFRVDEIRTCL